MNIFLVGLPYSGKTTFGKLLANYLKYNFIDLDEKISIIHNKSVPDLIKENEESYFRICEKECLINLLVDNTVISTGGGTPCHFDNMKWMNNNGITIFLNTELSIILERANLDKNERPLFCNDSNFLIQLKNERIQFYQQAKIES